MPIEIRQEPLGSGGTPPLIVPVTFDAASSSGPGTASLTWSHTCSGTNRYLVVGSSSFIDADGQVPSVTYNGVAMTLIGELLTPTFPDITLYGLIAPATGAHNVVLTFAQPTGFGGAGAISFNGVNQVTPTGAFVAANANDNAPTAVNGTILNGMIAAVCGTFGGTVPVPVSGTQRFSSAFYITVGATQDGMITPCTYSLAAADFWSLATVPIKP